MRVTNRCLLWTPTRIEFLAVMDLPAANQITKVSAPFLRALCPASARLLNEYHALIVNTGKQWCRKSAPRCESCPLRHLLPEGAAYAPANAPLGSATPA